MAAKKDSRKLTRSKDRSTTTTICKLELISNGAHN